jgi:mannosyltransferase
MAKKRKRTTVAAPKQPPRETPFHRLWHHPALAPASIMALALVLRLPNFTASLWYDEVCHTYVNLGGSHLSQVLFGDVHPPLYPLFMRGWIALFGDGEIAIRLPSLVLGVASIGISYAIAETWFGRGVAVLSTLLMALSPFHVWYSQEAKTNMLLLFLTVLALRGLQQAWLTGRRGSWLLFISASILSLWTNHFALWAFAASAAWLWLQVLTPRGRERLGWIAASTIVIALAYTPALIIMATHMSGLGRGYLRPFTPLEAYNLFLIYLSHGNTLRTVFPWALVQSLRSQPGAYFFLELFFLVIALRGVWVIARTSWPGKSMGSGGDRTDTAGRELVVFLLIVPPLLLLPASVLRPQLYVERSMIFMLPSYFMLLAYGALSFDNLGWRVPAAGLLLLLGALSLYNLWGPKAEVWTVWMPKADWRQAADYFSRQATGSGGQKFLIFQTNPEFSLAYYYDRQRRDQGIAVSGGLTQQLPLVELKRCDMPEVEGHLARTGARAAYFVHNHQWTGGFPRVMKSVTRDPRFRLTDTARFRGITVYSFSVAEPLQSFPGP